MLSFRRFSRESEHDPGGGGGEGRSAGTINADWSKALKISCELPKPSSPRFIQFTEDLQSSKPQIKAASSVKGKSQVPSALGHCYDSGCFRCARLLSIYYIGICRLPVFEDIMKY